jgi:hypothetical protein
LKILSKPSNGSIYIPAWSKVFDHLFPVFYTHLQDEYEAERSSNPYYTISPSQDHILMFPHGHIRTHVKGKVVPGLIN